MSFFRTTIHLLAIVALFACKEQLPTEGASKLESSQGSSDSSPKVSPVVIIHGGLGPSNPNAAQKTAMENALEKAYAALTARDKPVPAYRAVMIAIATMEDSGACNAGKGAPQRLDGLVRLDASIMTHHEGHNLFGALALGQTIKNPIFVAAAIMKQASENFLPGRFLSPKDGGTKLVEEMQDVFPELPLETVDPRAYYKSVKKNSPGTVGAVVLDSKGNLAAGTSTGGMSGRVDRIGDSPVIGAGTWADDTVAVSTTGVGEKILAAGFSRGLASTVEFFKGDLSKAFSYFSERRPTIKHGAFISLATNGSAMVGTMNE